MAPRTIRWGILATGGIAKTFSTDLTVDPKTRGVDSIRHEVVAAASSTSQQRAQDFLKSVNAPSSAKAYGSYKELVADPNVEIIYVASPHSHHYQNAMLCLEAGKNVLCEKALTVNAKQAKLLVEKAKEKNLFFMEAVWTRYFPLSIYVRELITSGKLGNIHRVLADNSIYSDPEKDFADGKHRMVNPDLAGGALLDLGIYSLTWVFQTLYTTMAEKDRKKPAVQSFLKKYEATGSADEMTTMILNFQRPKELGGGVHDVHAIATTALRFSADPSGKDISGPSIRVQGTKGEVQVFPPAFRPTKTKLILNDGTIEDKEWKQPSPEKDANFENGFGGVNADGEAHGMFWEADECAYALVEGRKEGQYEGWDESIVIMEIMDEVRQQAGLVYPDNIESTEYPLNF